MPPPQARRRTSRNCSDGAIAWVRADGGQGWVEEARREMPTPREGARNWRDEARAGNSDYGSPDRVLRRCADSDGPETGGSTPGGGSPVDRRRPGIRRRMGRERWVDIDPESGDL